MRKEDKSFRSFERSNRFYETDSGWFFTIRQGAVFGPYESRNTAEKGLMSFVSLLKVS